MRPLVINDFATAPFWISLYVRKILFYFLSVQAVAGFNSHENDYEFRFCTYIPMVGEVLLPAEWGAVGLPLRQPAQLQALRLRVQDRLLGLQRGLQGRVLTKCLRKFEFISRNFAAKNSTKFVKFKETRSNKAQETKSTKEIPLNLKPFRKMLLFRKPLYCKVKMDSRSQKEREEEGAEQSEVPPTSSSLGHSISCIPGLYSTGIFCNIPQNNYSFTLFRILYSESASCFEYPRVWYSTILLFNNFCCLLYLLHDFENWQIITGMPAKKLV